MQFDLSRLTDQELGDFLRLRGVQSFGNLISQTQIELQNAINQGTQVTEAILDLVLATNANITSSPQYTESQIRSLDPDTLDAFAKIFGLTGETPNVAQRLIRILRIKGLLQSSPLGVELTVGSGGTPKQRKDAEKEVQDMTVAVTGARSEEYLVGIRNVTKDAMIKVKVTVQPYKKALDTIRLFPDLWRQFLDKLGSIEFFSMMNREERAQWLAQNQSAGEIDIAEFPNSQIEIVQLGNSDLGTKLTQEQINEILSEPNRSWNTMGIREMFPRKPGSRAKRHTLFFLRQFWKVHTSYEHTDNFAGFSIDISNGGIYQNATGNIIVLDIGKSPLGFIIPTARERYTEEEIFRLILGLQPNMNMEDIENIRKATRNFTAGALKSLLQKIMRFRAKMVSAEGQNYPSEFVLLVTCGLLALSPGSFVPDIQRYVSGPESFCKRLSVTIFEDSFVEPSDYPQIISLLSSALLIQRVKGWLPPIESFRAWFQLAIRALNDTRFFIYNSKIDLPAIPVQSASNYLQLASSLLDELKSFKGDLNMFRSIAQNNGSGSPATNMNFPTIMPIEHCIDQHWAPDIAYYYESSIVEPFVLRTRNVFGELFANLFGRVTGINSRKAQINMNDSFVIATRKAQYLTLLSKQVSPRALEVTPIEPYQFSFTIDQGWIAGLVGPLTTTNMRLTALITMLPNDINQLVAVKMPSREMKEAQLTDQQQETAIIYAKQVLMNGVRLKAVKPPVDILSEVTLHRTDDEEGNTIYYIMHQGQRYTLEQFSRFTIPIPISQSVELTLENALTYFGTGMIANSAQELQRLVSQTPMRVLRRVLSYISGYHHQIVFHEIGRDGGGSDQPVTFFDIDAFQFLLKVTLIYPLALRKTAHTFIKFDVPLQPLLWVIRDFIAGVVNQNIVFESVNWGDIRDLRERTPWAHQIDSVNEMKARNQAGKRGNFLWIPVGMGKTLITLLHIKYLKSINKLPPYVIYTLPDEAFVSVQEEILAFGFRVENLNPTQTNRAPQLQQFTKRGCIPTPYTITMIEHDHIRLCRDTLTEIMPNAIFIVDEVHKTLNDTLRTSTALELAGLSQDFILLTGTPVIDTKIYKLTNWLAYITDFEVNNDNFWVAINNLISKKINTGVIPITEEIEASFIPQEEQLYRSLVSPNLGGTNLSGDINSYNEAINICYNTASREMINQVLLELRQGNGVMLVARNLEHQEQLFNNLLQRGLSASEIFLIRRGQSIFLTDENVAQGLIPNYRVVITTIRYHSGYTLTRFHVMVSSVYPSNLSVRQQTEGRINRLGQHSRTVTYKYVHLGILTHIMLHHKDAQSLNEILRSLAKEIIM